MFRSILVQPRFLQGLQRLRYRFDRGVVLLGVFLLSFGSLHHNSQIAGKDRSRGANCAGKESLQPVIVALRDRLVFVIVAARALYGETQQSASDDLLGIEKGSPLILGEIRRQKIFSGGIYSRPEETSGLQILHYVGRNLVVFVVLRDLVTGNLLGEKVVVGLVGVERPDYVVAVAPGVGADAVLGEHSLR